MGVNHSPCGLAARLATLAWCPNPDPAHQAAWLAAWTGTALLPDIDSGSSMASRVWGPVSSIIAKPVA